MNLIESGATGQRCVWGDLFISEGLDDAGVSSQSLAQWMKGGAMLMVFAAVGNVAGFAASLVAEHVLGAPRFAAVMASLGLAGGATIPATLLTLSAAAWVVKQPNWRTLLPWVQVAAAVTGAFAVFVVVIVAGGVPEAWIPWLVVLGATSYILEINLGILLGRQSFVTTNAMAVVPNVTRFVALVSLWAWLNPDLIIAISASATMIGALISSLMCYRSTDSASALEIETRGRWAPTTWVALMNGLWMNLDITVAYRILPARAAGQFSVIAVIAKAPFYLGRVLATKSIGESLIGRRPIRNTVLSMAAIGVLALIGTGLIGSSILTLMRVSNVTGSLAAMMIATTALGFMYLFAGLEASAGRHLWWIGAGTFVVWLLYLIVHVQSLNSLSWAAAILNGVGTCVYVIVWYGRALHRTGSTREGSHHESVG